MKSLISLYNSTFGRFGSDAMVPTLARAVFLAVLAVYYLNAAGMKTEGGFFSPSAGGFAQIFPMAADAALYDVSQMTVFQRLVVIAGMLAEYILPVLLVLGLFTRAAALRAIGLVAVQTLVDVTGHGAPLGRLFDSSIGLLDERTMWVFLLLVLVLRGAGPLSVDRVLKIA